MKRTEILSEEKNEFGLPGIGIPAEVLIHPHLTPTEKLLFGLIQNLDYTEKGCWASNKWLGAMLGVGPSTISNGVSNLNKYGFVTVTYHRKTNGMQERRIKIFHGYPNIYSKLVKGGYEKIQRGVRKNSEGYLKKFVPPSEKIASYINNYISNYKNSEYTSLDEADRTSLFDNINSEQDLIKPSHFEQFWKLYPSRGSKGKAKKRWEALCRKNKRPTWKEIKQAVQAQKESEQWQTKKYIPHASTWINQERWLDDPSEMKSFAKDNQKKPSTGYRNKKKRKYKTDTKL